MDFSGLTLEVVQNFISNLGFPIFMCLYFMYSQRKAENRHDKVIDELKCLQAQQLETKLQTAQAIDAAQAAPAPVQIIKTETPTE